MPRPWSHAYTAALLACAAAAVAVADSGPASRPANLEIIIKFTPASDAGRGILAALEKDPQDLRGLGTVQRELEHATGFVLVPVRITSGRELLVRIPEAPALEKVRQSISKRPQIADAALIAIQEQNPHLAQSMLLVRFRPGSAESELLGKAPADDARAAEVQALAAELGADSGVPLLGSTRADGALALELDRQELLRELVARLKSLPDVVYAQANAGVQIMN